MVDLIFINFYALIKSEIPNNSSFDIEFLKFISYRKCMLFWFKLEKVSLERMLISLLYFVFQIVNINIESIFINFETSGL